MASTRWSDERVDRFIGIILQAGVLASGALVLVGGVLYLIHFGATLANYSAFDADRSAIHGLASIVSAAVRFDGQAVIQLGILALVATPVIRVLFSILAFGVQRDRLYVPITLIVLAILLYGLFGGAH